MDEVLGRASGSWNESEGFSFQDPRTVEEKVEGPSWFLIVSGGSRKVLLPTAVK